MGGTPTCCWLHSFLLGLLPTSYPVFQSSSLFLDGPPALMALSDVWFPLHLSPSCFEAALTHHSFIPWIFSLLYPNFPGSRSACTCLKTWIRNSSTTWAFTTTEFIYGRRSKDSYEKMFVSMWKAVLYAKKGLDWIGLDWKSCVGAVQLIGTPLNSTFPALFKTNTSLVAISLLEWLQLLHHSMHGWMEK